jgi:hypothetical protein
MVQRRQADATIEAAGRAASDVALSVNAYILRS